MGKAVCAGIAISIGCITNLVAGNKLVGAVLFGVGLLAVCVHGFTLFTGTVCRVSGTRESIIFNAKTLFLNAVGVVIAAVIFGMSNIDTNVMTLVANKIAESPLEIIGKAMFCNILICIAVDEWKEQKNSLMVLFPVTVFVFCGFEHCIANLFYMLAAKTFSITFFFWNVVGNAIGGIMFWRFKHFSTTND